MKTSILYLCRSEKRKEIRMGIMMSNPIAVKKDNTITVGKLEYIFITINDVPEKIQGMQVVGVMYDEHPREFPNDVIKQLNITIRKKE